jgi:precorrin-2 dehydrogenase
MSLFPMFLKLESRLCLVVGAGAIAEGRIRSLLEAGAIVCVVSPRATPRVHQWSATGAIKWLQRKFTRNDLDGKFLVIAATSSAKVNALVFKQARRKKVLCNSVDDPPHCDFFYAAVVRRGDLQIAISTNGKSPALAQRLRKRFEQQFGPKYADKIHELGAARERLFHSRMEPVRRRELLLRMARAVRLRGGR